MKSSNPDSSEPPVKGMSWLLGLLGFLAAVAVVVMMFVLFRGNSPPAWL